MSCLSKAIDEYSSDTYSIQSYCDELYTANFEEYFSSVRDLYERLKSKSRVISDSELEDILTNLPMNLFVAAEALNRFRLEYEVIKLKNKAKKDWLTRDLYSEVASLDCSVSDKKEYVNRSLSSAMLEYEILLCAIGSLISRVENEMTFSKELIMSAKKIWDSRRSAETSNPVSPVDSSKLPEYRGPDTRKGSYIR